MTTVLLDGRRLPHIDYEGDDATPGAGGRSVTCTDSAAGRAVYWASNGRVQLDGRQIRAAVHPHDPDGINLRQAKQAVESLTSMTIVIPSHWGWTEVALHLKTKPYVGLIAQGWYAEIPARLRYQDGPGEFGHAVWLSHWSLTSGIRTWDALDRNEAHHGQWIAPKHIRAFMEGLARRERGSIDRLYCGYVPLQHL
jgi:hypothetical protein